MSKKRDYYETARINSRMHGKKARKCLRRLNAGKFTNAIICIRLYNGRMVFLSIAVGLAAQTRAQCGVADVVFVLDKSTSLGSDNWQAQINFVKDVVDALPIGPNQTMVGSVSYSTRAIVDFHLNAYTTPEDLKTAFR